jgi:hypothetical protein
MPACSEKDQLGDIPIIESDASTVWAAILADLQPDDVGFVFEAPGLHRLQSPGKQGIGTPEVKMGFSAAIFEITRATKVLFRRGILLQNEIE